MFLGLVVFVMLETTLSAVILWPTCTARTTRDERKSRMQMRPFDKPVKKWNMVLIQSCDAEN